jgi:hypothetical protein
MAGKGALTPDEPALSNTVCGTARDWKSSSFRNLLKVGRKMCRTR